MALVGANKKSVKRYKDVYGVFLGGFDNDYFKYFWQNMSNLCPNFKDYQDDFFFLKYTKPATEKIEINLAMLRNLYNDEESIKEYLTCLTSYIYSITPEAQVEGMTFGKGDVVPFLYYKDRKHADIDVRNDLEALMDIAKYAYVALIEGWCTLPTPYHLWENEYNFLFGNYEPNNLDYDLETLHEWYDETYQRYSKDKGRKGNNLLGSDINHIIESDYSIEQQLEATEYYLRQVFNELGIDSDFKETMARNELMAKYMMQNSGFDETIKDYNITIKFMTENLQRGTQEEQNTHTVVTSDFQTLEFNYTMNRRFIEHSDEDMISDGAELGNEKWINITEFARRTYEDAKSKGESHKVTFEEQVEDIIEKNGAYTDFNGNKVYGSVKWDDTKTKVLYRVYDYKSNPKLNDTDFDGLWDNADSKPLDNKFKGTSTGIDKVEYNQDFRWFYTDNQKYNDEVAVMSLIMSNLADGNSVSTDQVSGDITTYLRNIGFANPQNIGEYGDNIYIAKKTVQYYDQKKDVVGVFLGKCDRWYSEVIKYKENQKAQVINTAYRESLESYIIRIINKVNLIATSDCSYWVAGYDVGGSIASELSAKLVDTGKVVYCYTFGAFNTRDSLDTKNEIKNLRNEDDFAVKFIAGTKPGQNYGTSIFENLMWEYRDLTNSSDYKGNFIFTNYLLYVYDNTEISGTENEETMIDIFDNYMLNFNRITNQDVINDFADLCILMDKWADGNRHAHSIKSYYVLAKSLNGFDLLDGDGEKQEHYGLIDESLLLRYRRTEDYYDDLDNYENSWETVSEHDGKFKLLECQGYMKFIIPKGRTSAEAYFIINGAANFIYDVTNYSNNNWTIEIKGRNINHMLWRNYTTLLTNLSGRNLNGKVIYKKGIIDNGFNEYIVKVSCLGTNNADSIIRLGMVQYRDVTYNEMGGIWEGYDDTIYPVIADGVENFYSQAFKRITYLQKDLALFYAVTKIKINENNAYRKAFDKYLNKTIKWYDYINDIGVYKTFSKAKDIWDNTKKILEGSNPLYLGIKETIYNAIETGVRWFDEKEQFYQNVGESIGFDSYRNNDGDIVYTSTDGLIIGEKEKGVFSLQHGIFEYDLNCIRWNDNYTIYGQVGAKGKFK